VGDNELDGDSVWFPSERIFRTDDGWYVLTRKGNVGPLPDRRLARRIDTIHQRVETAVKHASRRSRGLYVCRLFGLLVFLVLFHFIASEGLPLMEFGEASGLAMLLGFWLVGIVIHFTLPGTRREPF